MKFIEIAVIYKDSISAEFENKRIKKLAIGLASKSNILKTITIKRHVILSLFLFMISYYL
nr:hypothetical protein Z965_p0075 [Clostridium novyi A str. BKT29909]